jgi:hypothetical protein
MIGRVSADGRGWGNIAASPVQVLITLFRRVNYPMADQLDGISDKFRTNASTSTRACEQTPNHY